MTTAQRRPADQRSDAATIDDLGGALAAILPNLERFLRFEGPDPAAHRSDWAPRLDRRLPVDGVGRDRVLADLSSILIDHGLRIGHPGFSGWVTTAPTTIGAVAGLAQSVAAAQRWWGAAGNSIDSLAMGWLVELLGFPATYGGSLTSGGSTANLAGLGAARQHAAERLGIDAALDGIAAIPEPRVYASTETHHVVQRALGILGLGRRHLRTIPLDADHRLDVGLLQVAIDEDAAAGRTPIAIVGNGGDVNFGLVDPLPALARIAHDRDIWFHVDGAYGGFGLLDARVADRYGDVAAFDSFAVDPHKWLAAPVGTGAIIVRDVDILGRAFTVETGAYDAERAHVTVDDTTDLGSPFDELGQGSPDLGVDFSTPARGVAVWAILAEIGARGMRERVGRHLDCARRVGERATSEPELELLLEPELSICCFRYRPAGWSDEARLGVLNEAILRGVRARGRCTTSATQVDGRYAIRPCFINPRTTLADADALIDEVLIVGRELSRPAV